MDYSSSAKKSVLDCFAAYEQAALLATGADLFDRIDEADLREAALIMIAIIVTDSLNEHSVVEATGLSLESVRETIERLKHSQLINFLPNGDLELKFGELGVDHYGFFVFYAHAQIAGGRRPAN